MTSYPASAVIHAGYLYLVFKAPNGDLAYGRRRHEHSKAVSPVDRKFILDWDTTDFDTTAPARPTRFSFLSW